MSTVGTMWCFDADEAAVVTLLSHGNISFCGRISGSSRLGVEVLVEPWIMAEEVVEPCIPAGEPLKVECRHQVLLGEAGQSVKCGHACRVFLAVEHFFSKSDVGPQWQAFQKNEALHMFPARDREAV